MSTILWFLLVNSLWSRWLCPGKASLTLDNVEELAQAHASNNGSGIQSVIVVHCAKQKLNCCDSRLTYFISMAQLISAAAGCPKAPAMRKLDQGVHLFQISWADKSACSCYKVQTDLVWNLYILVCVSCWWRTGQISKLEVERASNENNLN